MPKNISDIKENIIENTLYNPSPYNKTEINTTRLTPYTLAKILRDPLQNECIELAKQMEENDAHYAAVIATRKNAVSAIKPNIEPASQQKTDLLIAFEVTKMIERINFAGLCEDLLDGLGKGMAAVEIYWECKNKWMPEKFVWKDQRYFQNRNDEYVICLPNQKIIPIPEYKFIIHTPKLRAGPHNQGGLAKLCAMLYMYKTYTLRDWMAFLEVFGMPVKIGKYGNNATQEDIKTLQKALYKLGADGAGVIPREMDIEFIAAQNGRGQVTFGQFAEYIDKQISKAVLGQTMTVDEGGSLAQSQTHDAVRHDIIRADAQQLTYTLNKYLVRPFVKINFNIQDDNYPMLKLNIPKKQDLQQLANNLAKLIPLGLTVNASEIRQKFGLSEPQQNQQILK